MKTTRKKYSHLPYLTGIILLGVTLFTSMSWGWTEGTCRYLIRITARVSLVLFLLAFTASSFHYFWKNQWTKTLLNSRRYIGISFAVSHTFHLIFVLLLAFYFHAPNFEERGLETVTGGAMAYILMYIMAFSSTDEWVKRLGYQNWKNIHTIGSIYILLVFSVSYFGRAVEMPEYRPYALVILFSIILKLAFKVKSSKTR